MDNKITESPFSQAEASVFSTAHETEAKMSPPPPPSQNPNNQTPIIMAEKNRLIKKALLIVILFLLLISLGFLTFKFLLPKFSRFTGFTKNEVQLTWWGLWEEESVVAPIIEEYQNQNPKVKINYIVQSKEEYRERLSNALAQKKGPDIFRFHNSWVPMLKNQLSAVPSDIYTSQEFVQTFYPVAVSDLTTEKGILGIPLEYDGLGLFINEEIFATYGKSAPRTWDELRDIAVDLTIKDENGVIQQSGVALGRTENVDHWQEILALMMLQNGVDLTKPSGDLAEGALGYFNSISSIYKIWDETLPPSTIYFASGKLAMYFGPSWRAFEILEQNPSLKFRVVAVPQLPKDDPSEPDITYATYWVEGVWQGSSHQREAWRFLKYLSSRDTLQKLYQAESQVSSARRFGEPYSRTDMRDLLVGDPVVGGFISLAPNAKSWYLYSRTFDGKTGINTRMSDYFEDAVNAARSRRGGSLQEILTTLAAGVQQVLVDYGLATATPPPAK